MRKIDHDNMVQRAVALIARHRYLEDLWEWSAGAMRPKAGPKLYYDRDFTLLGLRIMDYWPGKPKPLGWSILWHRWNWGCSLSYNTPPLGGHPETLYSENETTIHVDQVYVQDKPSFWQRRFPKHFMLTAAKLCNKWRVTRHLDPFMQASFAATPILSQQEWAALGTDGPEILDNPNASPSSSVSRKWSKQV